jgi:hypothetical protein
MTDSFSLFEFKMTPRRQGENDTGVLLVYAEELLTKPTKVPLEYGKGVKKRGIRTDSPEIAKPMRLD